MEKMVLYLIAIVTALFFIGKFHQFSDEPPESNTSPPKSVVIDTGEKMAKNSNVLTFK
ncbi:MAG TPA: hypothetical protein VFA52_01340 [Candidatus Paceibacterota bacterium]|nr:hypothetical protein [Candidatus Paceibacterota bacterium]